MYYDSIYFHFCQFFLLQNTLKRRTGYCSEFRISCQEISMQIFAMFMHCHNTNITERASIFK